MAALKNIATALAAAAAIMAIVAAFNFAGSFPG